MTADPRGRRSRRAWPLRDTGPDIPEHDHGFADLPRIIWGLVALVVALTLAVALLGAAWIRQQTYNDQMRDYLSGRGEQRDRETQQLEQRITDAVCDLLDQLPEGGLLVRPREKYGCGPGIPLSAYPPDVQDQLRNRPNTGVPQTVAPKQETTDRPAWPGTGSAPNTTD